MKIIAPFCIDDWFKVDFWKTEVLNVFLIMFFGISQLEILGLLMYALRHSGVFDTGSNCYGKQQQARINCVAGVSRSGGVGIVLSEYFNKYLENNEWDYEGFFIQNRQIIPNATVSRILKYELFGKSFSN